MAKKKAAKAAEDPFRPTCGNCHFYEAYPDSEEVGECYFNPPFALIDGDGELFVTRPPVEPTARACGRHRPRMNA